MKGFSEASSAFGKDPRLSDLVDVFPWPEGEPAAVRPFGPLVSYEYYWAKIATANRPAPQGVSFPLLGLDWDVATGKHVTDVCPFRASGLMRASQTFVCNAIVRDIQCDERGNPKRWPVKHDFAPEKLLEYKAYWGQKGDARKTPVRVIEIPDSQLDNLQGMRKANKVRTKDGFLYYDIMDEAFGCEINLLYDPNKKGPARYNITKGDRAPITPEERRYIIYPLTLLKPMSVAAAKAKMADLEPKLILKNAAAKPAGKSPRGGRNEADDDLVDMDESALDGDDEAPRRSNARTNSRREEPEDEVEDDLDSELDADLDEDESPRGTRRDSDDAPRSRRTRADEDDLEDAPRSRRTRADEDDLEDAPRSRRTRADDAPRSRREPAPRRAEARGRPAARRAADDDLDLDF